MSIVPDMNHTLILASASPRRRQLLSDAGYQFSVEISGVEEPEPETGSDPSAYVAELAWKKARAVAIRHVSGLILAADTTCAVAGEILNKPIDRADAERMIRLQEGRDTKVITGLCLYRADRHEWVGAIDVSIVRVSPMTDHQMTEFLVSGRWEGKAGGYGVQDDDPFVKLVTGSVSNVVGLPMERLAALLAAYPELSTLRGID